MIDRKTIKQTGEVGVHVMDKPSQEERLRKVLEKHRDILGVFSENRIFNLYCSEGGRIYIEEACDYHYDYDLTKDDCNMLADMFRDISYCIQK